MFDNQFEQIKCQAGSHVIRIRDAQTEMLTDKNPNRH